MIPLVLLLLMLVGCLEKQESLKQEPVDRIEYSGIYANEYGYTVETYRSGGKTHRENSRWMKRKDGDG